jgi:UTP--glucose-1-phosphate uridylyltransferase
VVGAKNWQKNSFEIDAMVEKPKRDVAPSNLIISGRYILQPEIFEEIEHQSPGAGGEIQITDAMQRLMTKQPFYGLKFDGKTYDCGDKIGFLAANVAYGLDRADLGPAFREELERIITANGGTISWP